MSAGVSRSAKKSNPYIDQPLTGLSLLGRLIAAPAANQSEVQQREIHQLRELIQVRWPVLAEQDHYPDKAQAIQRLEQILRQLEDNVRLPALATRITVGVGGALGVGKSRLLNALCRQAVIAERVNAATAIPVWLMQGSAQGMAAINTLHHVTPLDDQAVQAISHDYQQHFRAQSSSDVGFAHVLRLLVAESPAWPWRDIAVLDTPGYVVDSDIQMSHTNAESLCRQLACVDYVLWIVNASHGAMTAQDILILKEVAPARPIFVLLTQADQMAADRINDLMQETSRRLAKASIDVAGMAAWALPEPCQGKNVAGDDLCGWFNALARGGKTTLLRMEVACIISDYMGYHEAGLEDNRQQLAVLKKMQLLAGLHAGHGKMTFKAELQQAVANLSQAQGYIQQQLRLLADLQKEIIPLVDFLVGGSAVADYSDLVGDYERGNRLYEAGELPQAIELWQKAAMRGDVEAQHALGDCHRIGLGVFKSNAQAVKWYRKAAEKHHRPSEIALGVICADGKGSVVADESEIFQWVSQSATMGHASSQYMMGERYYYGEGVQEDKFIASEWYRKAAEQGHAESQYSLGFMYGNEDGVKLDKPLAVAWCRKAAQQGHAGAQCYLGDMCFYGEGVIQDIDQALIWYQKSAEQGDAEAQCALGYVYAGGRGVPLDLKQAVEWYTKAAEQENIDAQYQLGFIFANDVGAGKDITRAMQWWRRAGDHGNANAQYGLGVIYYTGEDTQESKFLAAQQFQKAAEQGHAEAQNMLGVLYDDGEGVRQDKHRAFDLFLKAAEQGNDLAQCNLANKYYSGDGVAIDKSRALYWFGKAAELGNVDAQCHLGWLLYYGDGVAEDKKQAVEWVMKAAINGCEQAQVDMGVFCADGKIKIDCKGGQRFIWVKKAAEAGDVMAQYKIGVLYEKGQVVKKNQASAIEWYVKAAGQGNCKAQERLGKIYSAGSAEVAKDLGKAVHWYTQLATSGDIAAHLRLAEIYESAPSFNLFEISTWGGVTKNLELALQWYEGAADLGNAEALYKMGCYWENGLGCYGSKEIALDWYRKAAAKNYPGAQEKVNSIQFWRRFWLAIKMIAIVAAVVLLLNLCSSIKQSTSSQSDDEYYYDN